MIKYSHHRTNADGSCDVGFLRPDGREYVVKMSSKWKGKIFDWIEKEGIEIFLYKKFNHDIEYDKFNNIHRRMSVNLKSIRFIFDSFDGDIEIYNATTISGTYLLDSLTDFFDLDNPKFTEPFKERVQIEYNIKVKNIRVVKTRWDDNCENVVINGTWEEWNRNEKIKQLDI